MSELSTIGAELLGEIKADAPEALRTISYKQGATTASNISAIPDSLKFGEADGESVKVTDAVWLIFSHELGISPHAGDWITEDTIEHYVVRATADDPAGVLWRVITQG